MALDLSNFPPLTFDNIDVSVLLTQIERVKSKVDSYQVASESQIELSSALADSQGALTDRVASLENLVAKLSIKDSDSDIKEIELWFECTECDIKCGTKEALENHNAKVHTFECDICDHKCASEGNPKTHVESHKAEAHKEQGKETKMFSCSKCEYTTDDGSDFDKHGENYINAEVKSNVTPRDIEVPCGQEPKPFKCSECNLHFSTTVELESHTKTHREATRDPEVPELAPFKCSECDLEFPLKSEIEGHVKSIHEVTRASELLPFQCTECDSSFLTNLELGTHMNSAHSNTRYSCSKCNYKCARHDNLIMHMRTHERREATYVCSVCCYECTSEDLYNKHLLTHKGEAHKPKPRPKQGANKQKGVASTTKQ